MKHLVLILLTLVSSWCGAQQLKLSKRNTSTLSGSAFAQSIADTTLSLDDREKIIFDAIKAGNIPNFFRTLAPIKVEKTIGGNNYQLVYWVTPDYLSIGNDEDFFYIPTTPTLAQKIATYTKTMLPTKQMVDDIYNNAFIKLEPHPIPPSKLMTTVPIFIQHNAIVNQQLESFKKAHLQSALTAGNKKDIIISNKIYGQPTPRVVIYGWHKLDGKAIQPVYNKHTNTWADYSHGVRLVNQEATLNGKKIKLSAILKDPILNELLSDEGIIAKANYPL